MSRQDRRGRAATEPGDRGGAVRDGDRVCVNRLCGSRVRRSMRGQAQGQGKDLLDEKDGPAAPRRARHGTDRRPLTEQTPRRRWMAGAPEPACIVWFVAARASSAGSHGDATHGDDGGRESEIMRRRRSFVSARRSLKPARDQGDYRCSGNRRQGLFRCRCTRGSF